MPLRVDGYSCSESDRQTNLRTAKLRSNRIKSELITRQGLTEDCFITKNHAGKGDYVTVRLTIPKEEEKPAAPDETEKSDNALVNKEKETPAEEPQTQSVQAEQPATTETKQTPESLPTGEVGGAGSFSLRANLLRWATLTPDFGIEWRITACGASSYTARGLRGRGTTRTEGMPCGKYRPKCVAIWARNGAATSARCIRQAHSTTSCPPRAGRAT